MVAPLAKIGKGQAAAQRANKNIRSFASSILPHPAGHVGISKVYQQGGANSGEVGLGAAISPLFTPLIEIVQTVIDYLTATDFPSAAETISTYVTGRVTRADFECMMRLNGADPQAHAPVVAAQLSRPTDDQLTLLQRKLATAQLNIYAHTAQPGDWTQAEIDLLNGYVADMWAANGWNNQPWWQSYILAQEWVPSPTDAISWMLKDVADPGVTETFQLAAEFKQKYSGHVADVFSWNGIKSRDALNIWMAHWRNMAPTTLYELHKRLRPGWTVLWLPGEITRMVAAICPVARPRPGFDPYANRPVAPGPPENDLLAAGVSPEVAILATQGFPVPTYCDELSTLVLQQAWLESLGTTGFHVYEGLGQADYAPFWRERLLAISYRVMTRVDARRAYEIDQISFERLVAVFQDQGNNPSDSLNLATFVRNNAIQLHARRPVCNSWVNNRYDTDLLKLTLIRQGMREDMWPNVYGILSARRSIKVQQDCLKSIEKQYMVGLLTQNQVDEQLDALNVTGSDKFDLIKDWNCIKSTRSKAESAAQVCLYFKVGLIPAAEAQQLIVDLGYTRVQARRILALCFIRKLPKTIDTSKLPQALGLINSLPE